MADVYLSYSRSDRVYAARLAQALEESGVSVWWDSALSAGSQYMSEIERELENAKAIIVIWSPDSVNSQWVTSEARIAVESDKLIPLQLNDARLPLGFSRIQTLPIDSWDGDLDDPRFRRILEMLETRGIARQTRNITRSFERSRDSGRIAADDPGEEAPGPIFQTKPEDKNLDSAFVDVFVAYSRRDSTRCEDLILHLRQQDLDVFYDQFIRSGSAWRQSIASHIIGCSVFVVILSEHSIASQEVRNEINLATTHGKKIIPIFVEDVSLPGDFELMLSGLNYVLAFEDFDRRFVEAAEEAKTLVALEAFNSRRILAAKAGSTSKLANTSTPKAQPGKETTRKISMIWVAALLASAAGFAASLFALIWASGILPAVTNPIALFAFMFFVLGLPYATLIVLGIRNVASVVSSRV